jgi:aminoglycoside phosphotransferase (APT) family kinase protein
VPWPYLIEESEEIFGWNWAILPRAQGISMVPEAGHEFSREERWAQAAALGRALAALHTVMMPEPAVYDRAVAGLRNIPGSYGEYVQGLVERLLADCRAASDATTDEDVTWALSLVETGRAAFDQPFTPTVIHLDYSENNAILDRGPEGWHVAGVVDWMTAEVGHPEADLRRSVAHYHYRGLGEHRPFIGAYRSIHPQQPGFDDRFPVFMLWERLLIWGYGQRHGVWFPEGLTLRRWMQQFLDPSLYRV